MHSEKTIEQFIELRAQGWTLRHLARSLHVCQRTLIDSNREYADEITALRDTELAAAREKFLLSSEEMLNRLARLHKDVEDELAHRSLGTVATDKLFRIAADLRREIQKATLESDGEEPAGSKASDGKMVVDE